MFKPLNNKVLIKRSEYETQSSGGIIIPDTATVKPLRGVVISVGPGKRTDNGTLIPMSVNVGDTVLFTKQTFTEVKIDNNDYLIIDEDNLVGILEGE